MAVIRWLSPFSDGKIISNNDVTKGMEAKKNQDEPAQTVWRKLHRKFIKDY